MKKPAKPGKSKGSKVHKVHNEPKIGQHEHLHGVHVVHNKPKIGKHENLHGVHMVHTTHGHVPKSNFVAKAIKVKAPRKPRKI